MKNPRTKPVPKKRGRPKTKDGARSNRVQVLLHDHELTTITKAAKGSLSDFLRTAGIDRANAGG